LKAIYRGHWKSGLEEQKKAEEEQRFVEENHKLVYLFLNKRRLKVDDWYDILILDYLMQLWRIL